MQKRMALTLITGSMALILVSFQNCAQQKFSPTSSSGQLVLKPDSAPGTVTAQDNNLPPGTENFGPPGDSSNPPSTSPGDQPPSDTDKNCKHDNDSEHDGMPTTDGNGEMTTTDGNGEMTTTDGNGGMTTTDGNNGGTKMTDGSHDRDSEETEFVCIVQGAGKSLKIAYENSGLTDKVATPGDVCMTQHACLDIISQKFDVKEADDDRGFCKHDEAAQTVHLTDAQIQSLIDQMH